MQCKHGGIVEIVYTVIVFLVPVEEITLGTLLAVYLHI